LGSSLIWINGPARDHRTLAASFGGNFMIPLKAAAAALFAAMLTVSQAEAQVTVDVSKITCDQYITQRITHTRSVNIWISGFYAGRRNDPVLDTQQLERNSSKLSRFCEQNRDMLLLDAVGALKK
jgi:hypothetical protein